MLNVIAKNTTQKNLMLDTNEMLEVVKNIKKNDKIVLAKPDKGSGIVALDKTEYLRKMLEILDDITKFVKMGPANDFDNLIQLLFQNYQLDSDGNLYMSFSRLQDLW